MLLEHPKPCVCVTPRHPVLFFQGFPLSRALGTVPSRASVSPAVAVGAALSRVPGVPGAVPNTNSSSGLGPCCWGSSTGAAPALPGRGSPGFWEEVAHEDPPSVPSARTAQGAPCQGCGYRSRGMHHSCASGCCHCSRGHLGTPLLVSHPGRDPSKWGALRATPGLLSAPARSTHTSRPPSGGT